MQNQHNFVCKEDVYKMIDEIPEDKIMVITFNRKKGISNHGRMIKKKKGKQMTEKASKIVLREEYPVITITLHKSRVSNFVKSLLLIKHNYY